MTSMMTSQLKVKGEILGEFWKNQGPLGKPAPFFNRWEFFKTVNREHVWIVPL